MCFRGLEISGRPEADYYGGGRAEPPREQKGKTCCVVGVSSLYVYELPPLPDTESFTDYSFAEKYKYYTSKRNTCLFHWSLAGNYHIKVIF